MFANTNLQIKAKIGEREMPTFAQITHGRMADGLRSRENNTGGDVGDIAPGECVFSTGRPFGNDDMPSVSDASPSRAELWSGPNSERIDS